MIQINNRGHQPSDGGIEQQAVGVVPQLAQQAGQRYALLDLQL
jgi:hypothetical protein